MNNLNDDTCWFNTVDMTDRTRIRSRSWSSTLYANKLSIESATAIASENAALALGKCSAKASRGSKSFEVNVS